MPVSSGGEAAEGTLFAGVMMRDLLLGLMNVLGPSFSLAAVCGSPSLSLFSGGASHLQPHCSVRI